MFQVRSGAIYVPLCMFAVFLLDPVLFCSREPACLSDCLLGGPGPFQLLWNRFWLSFCLPSCVFCWLLAASSWTPAVRLVAIAEFDFSWYDLVCGALVFFDHFQNQRPPLVQQKLLSTWTSDPRIVDFGLALKIGWPVGPDLIVGKQLGGTSRAVSDFQGLEPLVAAKSNRLFDIPKSSKALKTLYILFLVPLEASTLN